MFVQSNTTAEGLEIVVEKQRNLIEPGLESKFSHLSKLGKGKPTLESKFSHQGVIELLQQEATLSKLKSIQKCKFYSKMQV